MCRRTDAAVKSLTHRAEQFVASGMAEPVAGR